MFSRLGLGPVFVYESITAARRWQVYAVRAIFGLALLGALSIAAISNDAGPSTGSSIQNMARLGEQFYYAIATVQIAVVLLVAPATTAGAICQERARGSLTHMLVTDLSNAEIILGKLGARLGPMFALIFAAVPVMAIASLLGGIIPETLVTLTLESLALATLGCALALAISVRAKKTHEVVMLVYAIWCTWVFGPFFWMIFRQLGIVSGTPTWLSQINPFTMAWSPYAWPALLGFWEWASFFAITLGGSAALVVYAMWRLRSEVRSGTERRRSRISSWLAAIRPGPKLDDNPVLWREWHRNRPSRTSRIIWTFYYVLAAGGSVAFVVKLAADQPDRLAAELGQFAALHVMFGLLFVSLAAPCALAEERVRGGLDVLLTTPLSTASVVWAKWRAAFRKVPGLMVIPFFGSLLAASLADSLIPTAAFFPGPNGIFTGTTYLIDINLSIGERIAAAVLPALMILAQGALITSMGLALAVWVPKVGRAMALSVTAYLVIAIGFLFMAELGLSRWVLETAGLVTPVTREFDSASSQIIQLGEPSTAEHVIETVLLSLSPIGGQIEPLETISTTTRALTRPTRWAIQGGTLAFLLGSSAALYGLTLLTFNRRLGRVPERPRKPPVGPDSLQTDGEAQGRRDQVRAPSLNTAGA